MSKWKWLVIPLLLLFVGCTTPQAVYDNMDIIKENLVIQKRVTDTLLSNIEPTNDRQIEAVADMRLRVEQKFDDMAAAVNRLVIYFEAEKEVGFITNIIDLMLDSELKKLFSDTRKEVRNESTTKDLPATDDAIVYNGDDSWVLSPTESGR